MYIKVVYFSFEFHEIKPLVPKSVDSQWMEVYDRHPYIQGEMLKMKVDVPNKRTQYLSGLPPWNVYDIMSLNKKKFKQNQTYF